MLFSGPPFYCLFKKNTNGAKSQIAFDEQILPSIKEYISTSDVLYNQIIEQISKVAELGENMAFVGIGQFAFKLLNSVQKLGIKNKILLFDNNILNEGKIINQIKVQNGKELVSSYQKEKFNIIITSLIYQNQISNSLKLEFELNSIEVPIICKLSLNEY
jgi:FlaA1/EpsC-like NDP-sugar epimerase